jgi:hypothetical protein
MFQTDSNKIKPVLFGLQNGTSGPYLATIDRILVLLYANIKELNSEMTEVSYAPLMVQTLHLSELQHDTAFLHGGCENASGSWHGDSQGFEDLPKKKPGRKDFFWAAVPGRARQTAQTSCSQEGLSVTSATVHWSSVEAYTAEQQQAILARNVKPKSPRALERWPAMCAGSLGQVERKYPAMWVLQELFAWDGEV